jgi:hypothetical protein
MPHLVQTIRGPNSRTRRSPGYLSTLMTTSCLQPCRPDAVLAHVGQVHRLDGVLRWKRHHPRVPVGVIARKLAALITTSPWTAPLIQRCLTQTSPGWAVQTTGPSREYRHSSGWGFLHHSASRARIIAGLFGFFTLIQFRDGPDR